MRNIRIAGLMKTARTFSQKLKKTSLVLRFLIPLITIAMFSYIVSLNIVVKGSSVQIFALGNIEEGQTISYTKTNMPNLGSILKLTTTKDNVYLHFGSDLSSVADYYSSYTIKVVYAAIGTGSNREVGDVVCTMTLATPNSTGVILDKAGAWRFDFEINVTAKSAVSDQSTTVTVFTEAETA